VVVWWWWFRVVVWWWWSRRVGWWGGGVSSSGTWPRLAGSRLELDDLTTRVYAGTMVAPSQLSEGVVMCADGLIQVYESEDGAVDHAVLHADAIGDAVFVRVNSAGWGLVFDHVGNRAAAASGCYRLAAVVRPGAEVLHADRFGYVRG